MHKDLKLNNTVMVYEHNYNCEFKFQNATCVDICQAIAGSYGHAKKFQ